ncbi:MAG: efflux RND transporter periplasmic adaptor subunit [Candidatus Ratteibacteria bacterium]|jgi:HlyD family secretion protein
MNKPNKKKRLLVFGSILAILFLVILAVKIAKNKESAPKFRTEKVTRGDVVTTVTATGAINPVTTVQVGTQVSGTIKRLFVDFNSTVRKGQMIAQIDPTSLEAQAEQQRAGLISAKANVIKAQASLLDADRTYKRDQELFSRNLIARSELDVAETNYQANVASVDAAKAQVTQAQASLKYVETNLGYARIVSPVDGIVISRNVDVGQTVAASFSTPTLFTIAQDLTKMQIDASVAEADIGSIKNGQPVEFTADAYPEDIFHGSVWQIRNAAITVSNVVTYDVVIRMDNKDLKLKPGMTANISFIISTRKGVLRVPDGALTFIPSDVKSNGKSKDRGAGVWILQDGKPNRAGVTTGESNGTFTEITSGQLQEGGLVITGYLVSPKNNSGNNSGQRPPRMF